MSLSSPSSYTDAPQILSSTSEQTVCQKPATPHFDFQASDPGSLHAIPSVSYFRISEDGKKALPVHPLKEISYKTGEGYNVIAEIIGGQAQKTELDEETGRVTPNVKNEKLRYVSFLPYPAALYGSIPQTVSDKQKGGDGDPLDVFIISSPADHNRLPGQVLSDIRIVGAIDMRDGGEHDVKLIGIAPDSPLSQVKTLNELEKNHPGILEVLETWLRNYKGPAGGVEIKGRLNEEEALHLIEEGHLDWQQEQTRP